VLENGEWRRRYIKELYQLFEEPDIVICIKINRLHWCGHVMCMDPQRRVQKVLIPNHMDQGKLEDQN
jgi:hypothetical protein